MLTSRLICWLDNQYCHRHDIYDGRHRWSSQEDIGKPSKYIGSHTFNAICWILLWCWKSRPHQHLLIMIHLAQKLRFVHQALWRIGDSRRSPPRPCHSCILVDEAKSDPRPFPDGCLIIQNTTTTCVPSFFFPRSRTASEVVVRRALGLYFQ